MVPKTLDEAAQSVLDILSPADIKKLCSDENIIAKVHHSFGRSIRNNWSLWDEESSLRQWFQDNLDIGHPDDISSIIMEAARAKAKGEPYDPKPTIKRFHQHWEKLGCNHFGEKV
jgi:hypothetical protein